LEIDAGNRILIIIDNYKISNYKSNLDDSIKKLVEMFVYFGKWKNRAKILFPEEELLIYNISIIIFKHFFRTF